VAYISGAAFAPRLVQLNKNKSLLKAFAIAAIVLGRGQIMAQVSAPTEPTSLSPAPAATASEAKRTPKDTATDNSTLDSFLKEEGFGVVKLERKNLDNQKAHKNYPKHLIIGVEVNRMSASLMVDTGTSITNIARDSLEKFGVVEQKTSHRVTSPLESASNKRRRWGASLLAATFYGIAKLNMLAMGNCVIQDVPVAIDAIPYVDGVLGSDDMHRIGAVLDCAEPALYYAPRGPHSDTSSKLAAMLQSNGFTQVPMRLTSNHQLEVACSINGVASTIIVDTGSAVTCVDKRIGIKAGIIMKHTRRVLIGAGGAIASVRIGRVKQFAIGDFEIRDADISFVDLKKADQPSAYLLGIGELVSNSAIIDVDGLSMYLRHLQ
jgi:predicted aspartyl protease